MGYVNCESAKDLVRMCLFEKKLSLFKEVAIFSIISFKIDVIGIVKFCFSFFWGFWCSRNCMTHEGCESVKDLVRMSLFEKKLSLCKEVAIFSIICFKIRSYWYCKICYFPLFLV